MQASLFTKVAIGRAAENKAINTRVLKIVPIELLGFLDGDIGSNPTPLTVEGVDADGQAFTDLIETDNIIEATWFPAGSNRVSAPDIRINERVEVYRYADTDTFYWRCMGLDDELRKLETVIFAISGTPNIDEHKLDVDNTYFVEFSTHTKSITLSTSKSNGELVRHVVRIDPGIGYIRAEDDIGNSIEMNSKDTFIRFLNADNTLVELDRKNINMSADQDITGKAKQSVAIDAKKSLTLTCGGSKVAMTPGNITVTSPTIDFKQG